MVKKCSKCNQEKDYYKDFSSNGKSTRSICKECEAQRARDNYNKSMEYLRSLKTKCSHCGYDKNPAALEYHHPDENKEANVARLARVHLSSVQLAKLHAEIEKCELLCANCHREEHNKQYNRY